MKRSAFAASAAGRRSGAFRRLYEVVARIPPGRVATYGQVARLAGMPGAARLAGWALHALPQGLRIRGRPVPWQRVINAQGRISPRAGDAVGEGLRQIRLLRRDGVAISRAGRIDLKHYGWDGL
ncbi:MAG TPA: MGMT family protein [Candidatus Cryosericum sp.]|nr:MGMT family protein [Candidatus Cryosericum sp.]